jgi:hypothetical protein
VEESPLVSVEFKYVPPRRVPNVETLVRQMKQHLTGHRASILVIYWAEPRSTHFDNAVTTLRRKQAGDHYEVVDVTGPEIEFP